MVARAQENVEERRVVVASKAVVKGLNSMIRKLDGANMDIDLDTPEGEIVWAQDPYPWNEAEGTLEHRCAVKNVSICHYFCGIEYQDFVLCCYPDENPIAANRDAEESQRGRSHLIRFGADHVRRIPGTHNFASAGGYST